MAGDIRYAAVDKTLYHKLSQALSIIQMRTLGARMDEWNGLSCDLLVAEAQDQQGQAAIKDAFGRGIPVVVVGDGDAARDGVYHLPRESTIAGVTRVLNGALNATA